MRIAIWISTAIVLIALWKWHDHVLLWMQSSPSFLSLYAGATLFSLFPIIPYPIVAGLLGIAYGPWGGGLIAWCGSTSASLIMFVAVRIVLHDIAQRWLLRTPRFASWAEMMDKQSFVVVLFARMIPIIPSIIINTYAGVGRMAFVPYAIASAIGKIPAMILFAVIGAATQVSTTAIILSVLSYALFGGGTWLAYRWWQNKVSLRTAHERSNPNDV
ncbi:MAG: VTT domain-containing protein [Paenibacillaceae bacterium]|jgi:uncharacterized membrane protein YdjX (TVP38/TMEM64 family)|nr:VTT domain-containing protein [Paenibacillaceae bacterium]